MTTLWSLGKCRWLGQGGNGLDRVGAGSVHFSQVMSTLGWGFVGFYRPRTLLQDEAGVGGGGGGRVQDTAVPFHGNFSSLHQSKPWP